MSAVVILRPEPSASATAARARALGLSPVIAPLFAVRGLDWQAPHPGRYDAVVMTSANAARHGGPQLSLLARLPLYAVGAATAEAARETGFERVIAGDGDGAAIAERARADGHSRMLHLAGQEHRALGMDSIAVYAAQPLPAPELPEYGVAMVHSPRAAARFAELAGDRARWRVVTISHTAAHALGKGWAKIVVADAPNDAAMLALARRLCESA